ncbi:MAG: hypothetical protein AAGI03_01605 [Pseudomonadota bacterium]
MLVPLMLRTCLVEGMKGRTSVGDSVFDSALTTMPSDGLRPFIAVYTGDLRFSARGGHPTRPLLGGSRCEVIFQYGLTAKMVETDEETDEAVLVGFGFPPLDAAMQMSLDIVGRQISNELVTPTSQWSEMAQEIAFRLLEPQLVPEVSRDDKVRLASHQLSILADLLDEPVARTDWVDRYLALLAASTDPVHADQIGLIEGLLSADLDGVEAARQKLGHSLDVWRSTPLTSVGDNGGEVLTEATIAVDGRPLATVTDDD